MPGYRAIGMVAGLLVVATILAVVTARDSLPRSPTSDKSRAPVPDPPVVVVPTGYAVARRFTLEPSIYSPGDPEKRRHSISLTTRESAQPTRALSAR
jgi:hypothetical protein